MLYGCVGELVMLLRITPRRPVSSTTTNATKYKTPPGRPVSMRTTFCKYLDRSSRLLPLLNPPFALGPTRPGPSASLTSPSFTLRIHQSTCTRSHHPVLQACSAEGHRKSFVIACHSLLLSYIAAIPPGQLLPSVAHCCCCCCLSLLSSKCCPSPTLVDTAPPKDTFWP